MAADRSSDELIGDVDDELAAERHRALFRQSRDAIIIWEDDRVALCNQAAVEMFGAGTELDVLHGRLGNLSPERQPDGQKSVEKMRGILDEVLAGSESRRVEWLHRRMDDTTFPAELVVTSVPGHHGTAVYAVIRDLTEQKRLEAELLHVQKMELLGSLAAGIAHDFNNTLMPISTYAALLEQSLPDRPEQQNWAAEIARAGDLASALVKKLMSVSRKQAHPPQPVTADLAAMVTDSLGMLRKLVGDAVRITVTTPDHPLWIVTEPGDVEQILLNLAANARDAMPDGGLIRFDLAYETDDGAGWAHLAVIDAGTGMSRETLTNVFDPFFTTKQLGAGTGLGMSSVHKLATAAGGRVSVDSELGQGTSVTVSWPVVAAPASRTGRGLTGPGAGDPQLTVLVVENDTAILRLITDVLDQAGHVVRAAGNGLRGLDVVERETPDLVITDVVMPHMGGVQMVRELRDRGHDLPVVFMSGHVGDEDLDSEVGNAGVEVLHKPFDADELIEAMSRCIRAHESER